MFSFYHHRGAFVFTRGESSGPLWEVTGYDKAIRLRDDLNAGGDPLDIIAMADCVYLYSAGRALLLALPQWP